MDRPQAPTPDQDDTVPTGHGPALKVSALMILALAGALAVAAGVALVTGGGVAGAVAGVCAGAALLAIPLWRRQVAADRVARRLRVLLRQGSPDAAGHLLRDMQRDLGRLGALGTGIGALAARAEETVRIADAAAGRARAGALGQAIGLADVVSALPLAVLAMSSDNRVLVHDAAAADALDGTGPLMPGQSIFAHLAEPGLRAALARLAREDWRTAVTADLATARGEVIEQVTLRRLGDDGDYVLSFHPAAPKRARRLAYDFGTDATAVAERSLRAVAYVALNAETTGLSPLSDDILEIGAIRMAGPAPGAEMTTLVDPGRPVPDAARQRHGIGGGQVHGAPGTTEAIRRLHRFAEGAIIVAHNAPFEMAFLHRYSREAGLRFENTVLDLSGLSRLLFGPGTVPGLEAMAGRFGVTVRPGDRHDAMGVARVTAEVFAGMIPLLESRGFFTVPEVDAALRAGSRAARTKI